MLNTRLLVLTCLLLPFLLMSYALNAKAEVYFGCENGFQFETKKKAARCIKQERQTFRSAEPCNKHKVMNQTYLLEIDKKGSADYCTIKPSSRNNVMAGFKPKQDVRKIEPQLGSKSFPPKCQTGFVLQVRKGKDTCATAKPEVIRPPKLKVKR